MSVLVTRESIETMHLPLEWRRGDYGAVLEFRGCVRRHHMGREVVAIDYDCELSMAHGALEKIRADILNKNSEVREIFLVHRIGMLELGETSLIVGLAGAHRKNLFLLCDKIIVEIKKSVPVWKREIYSDSSYSWLEGMSLQGLET